MRDRDTRTAILELSKGGHGVRAISRALAVSRKTIRHVLSSGSAEVPHLERIELAEPHEERIRSLFLQCKGNLVPVHEELAANQVELPYSTLTAFCRRRGIGQMPKKPAGTYHFEPGQEMQHDTSPHTVLVGTKLRKLQCASLVMGHSTVGYAQAYPVWNRFWAKVFLTDGIVDFGGAADQCMIDNASIIVASGTGKDAVIAPEMVAFGKRFGFHFIAHALGDANRSAHVERRFHFIENNFYAGRTFADIPDLNAQMRDWCTKVNGTFKKRLGARPMDLFVAEAAALHPLPLHVPDVYQLHSRSVDESGYVNLHNNRYSVPSKLLDRNLSLHETKDRLRIFDGHRLVCEHVREEEGAGKTRMLEEHKLERKLARQHAPKTALRPEELALSASSPAMAAMVDALKKRHAGRAVRALQRLRRMWLDYPQAPLDQALAVALAHGLFDLERIESLVLRHVAGDFFRLPIIRDEEQDDHE
jgi:transposase